MATGWAELWNRIRRLAEAGERDHEGTWTRFAKAAARSERAAVLKGVVRAGELLPLRERYNLAVAITRLLAPVEWPPEWVPARQKLILALDGLVQVTDPDAEPAPLAPHGPEAIDSSLEVAHLLFVSSQELLRRPCRRDELRTVATLCNAAVALCLRMSRRAHSRYRKADPARRGALDFLASTAHFEDAFAAYAEAANELNAAAGVVLFEGLFASLEQES